MTEVSVVIPCHTEKRLDQLTLAVKSVTEQAIQPAEIVVVVDHNGKLYDHLKTTMSGVTVLENRFARGVSGNRNTGVAHTRTPLIALLDDDAYAHAGWLDGLVAPFADPDVIGTGGSIVPVWESPRPSWFPDEFLWAVGGSYTGMPTETAEVRNVWSASMAVRRSAFDAAAGFRVGFGKVGAVARPEDTDLCLRMAKATGGKWVYVPSARIDHPVPTERTTRRFFLGRCFNEGRGKVELGRLNDGRDSLGSEQDYMRKTLPHAVRRGVVDTLKGRGLAPATRAGAVIAGACFAAAGGLYGVVSARRFASAAATAAPTPALPQAGASALTTNVAPVPAPRTALASAEEKA